MLNHTVDLVAAFLSDRTMRVKVNGTLSAPKPVQGGSPQGSILGTALFCITTAKFTSPPRIPPEPPDPGPLLHDGVDQGIFPSPIRGAENSFCYTSSDEDDSAIPVQYIRRDRRVADLSFRYDQRQLDQTFETQPSCIPLTTVAYIDDINCIEATSEKNAVSNISTKKRVLHTHAPQTQEFFDWIEAEADAMGMRVNPTKTQCICISSNQDDNVKSYFRPGTGDHISSGNQLKVLGFWFSNKPDVSLNIEKTAAKFRSKLWGLRELRDSGLKSEDLLIIYKSSLRPILEFANNAIFSMLTATHSEYLESLQRRAMKVVFSVNVSYNSVIDSGKIERLDYRRRKSFEKFALKTEANQKYEHWFPLHVKRRDTREIKKYREEQCRTERFYRSPVFAMRRFLNFHYRQNR